MVGGRKDKQTISNEQAMYLTNKPPDIEQMFDNFRAEADIE